MYLYQMAKIILTESQLKRLVETGSNSAAMDLDIYSQPMNFSSGDENLDVEESSEEIIDKLKELISMFNSGKKVDSTLKLKIHKSLDDVNDIYDKIKEKP